MADKPLVGGNNHKAIVEEIYFHAEALRQSSRNLINELEPIHHKLDPRILKLIREQADHIMAILLLTKDGQHLIENARNGTASTMDAKLAELIEAVTAQQMRIEMIEKQIGMDEELRRIVTNTEQNNQ